MDISIDEKDTVIKQLYSIIQCKNELSYDDILHKKVHSDLYIAIPTGISSILWFTYNKKNNKPCIYIIYINKYGKYYDIKLYNGIYNEYLVYGNGTIMFGIFKKQHIKDKQINNSNSNDYSNNINDKYILDLFIPLNIYYYKNNNVYKCSFITKLNLFMMMFKDIQFKYNKKDKNEIKIIMPVIDSTFINIVNISKNVAYKISYIGCIQDINEYKYLGKIKLQQETISKGYFKIKADIEQDIYYLYCLDSKEDEPYNIAFIQDFKTSVYMNNIFRNIKENKNLDLLEESDSEDEFENIDPEKFVDTSKEYIFECKYIHKFKKWKPIKKIINTEEIKILTKNETLLLERKK